MKLKFTVRDLEHGSWDNTRDKLLALGFIVDEDSGNNEVELRHENPDHFSDCAQVAKHLIMKHAPDIAVNPVAVEEQSAVNSEEESELIEEPTDTDINSDSENNENIDDQPEESELIEEPEE